MADIVGSAVAGEAVQRLSSLLSGEEGRDQETTEVKVERVELAVLKLETVVAMFEDWQITHAPLLRWRAKLKRVLKEGKGIVRSHRSLARRMRSTYLPRRMARVARRFVPFSRGTDHDGDDDDLTDSMVRRFERIADGADDFFDFVRRGGGRPRIMVFLPAFARSLAAGETTELSLRVESGTVVMMLQPWWLELTGSDHGGTKAAACLWMSYEHDLAWEMNFKVMAAFRASESVDLTRVATDCVDLLPPLFGAARAAMRELFARMSSHGRSSPAASAMYVPFVRAVQDSHRYGFEPATMCGGEFAGGGDLRSRLPEEILMVCAHCYVGNSSSGGDPLELVWHWSPLYTPKKLSEHHEHVELLPRMPDGLEAAGAVERGRQWWCRRSSTLLMVPRYLLRPNLFYSGARRRL